MGQWQGLGARWTWQQRRGGWWLQSQPNYCMARERDISIFCNVVFQQPGIHDLDPCAIVGYIARGRKGWLKKYRCCRQKFPLTLLPRKEHDKLTRLFGYLRDTCVEEERKKQKGSNWISQEMWQLIKQCSMLRCTGYLCQAGGRCLTCQICTSHKQD